MTTRWAALGVAGLVIGTAGLPDPARATDVTVTIGVPRLVVVLDTGVRYCEECDEDVFFYGGIWYVYRRGGWYFCNRWGGPWVIVRPGRLPAAFIRVPPGRFRYRWGGHQYHPAHDHHPKLDHWRNGRYDDRPRAQTDPRREGDRDRGGMRDADRARDGDRSGGGKDKEKKEKGKKGKGGDRGHGGGRDRR